MADLNACGAAAHGCGNRALDCLAVFIQQRADAGWRCGDRSQERLDQWMADFNAGKTERVCELFATDIRADFRGYPTRDHKAVCDLLAKSLTNKTRAFSYALDIKEIVVFGDVAVVRLVWTLTIKEKGGGEFNSVEPGMDIFQLQADGSWKIVRYMAYEE
jgi:ketosteroid isomerase-like protein